MKFLLLFLCLNFFPGDVYYITFVKGTIIVEKTQKPLKVGDKISPEDKLIFKEKDAMASIVSPQKGRFNVTATKVKPNNKGEFISLLEASMDPVPSTKKLATRSGALVNQNDLEKYFSANDSISNGRLLVISKSKYKIGKEAFPQNDKNFFYIRYNYNNESINKKLSFIDDTLLIDKTIYQIDGKDIDPSALTDMKLYYYKQGDKAESVLITPVNVVLVDEQELRNELQVLYANLKSYHHHDKNKIRTDLEMHVLSNYGKPEKNQLDAIINNILK